MHVQVDAIFKAAAEAANAARIPLAKMAVEETRMGIVEDKVRSLEPHACVRVNTTVSWAMLHSVSALIKSSKGKLKPGSAVSLPAQQR